MATKKTAVSKYLAEIGRRGGAAKVKKGFAAMNEEQRKAIASKAAAARWAKKNAKAAGKRKG